MATGARDQKMVVVEGYFPYIYTLLSQILCNCHLFIQSILLNIYQLWGGVLSPGARARNKRDRSPFWWGWHCSGGEGECRGGAGSWGEMGVHGWGWLGGVSIWTEGHRTGCADSTGMCYCGLSTLPPPCTCGRFLIFCLLQPRLPWYLLELFWSCLHLANILIYQSHRVVHYI